MPNGINTSADLSARCFPWDNDSGGLLAQTGLGPPRECLTPHKILTPDSDGEDDESMPVYGHEVIAVSEKAPQEGPLQSAVRRGIAQFPTKDQFEKQLLFKANHPWRNEPIERWHDYIQGPPPEHLSDAKKLEWQKNASAWQEHVNRSYNQAYEAEEAKLLANYKRTAAAAGAVDGFVKSLPFQLGFSAFPTVGGVALAWTTGVSTTEAVTGRNSGLQLGDLLTGNVFDHRKLSTAERFSRGANAVIGWTAMGIGYAGERSSRAATVPPTPAVGAVSEVAPAAGARQPLGYASNQTFVYDGREVRIVQTAEGPMAFYRRTGDGGVSPFGAQPGDWVPFEGFMPKPGGAGAHFVKPASVREFDPSQPLTLYRFDSEQARAAGEWIKANPPPGGAVDVGSNWRQIQLELERTGVPVMCPVSD